MSYYYHAQRGVEQIDPDLFAAWVAAGNPKAAGWTAIPNPPTPQHTYDGTAWVAPAWLTESIVAQIKAECERRQFDLGVPYTVPGIGPVRFQSDRDSRGRYSIMQGFVPLMLSQGATMSTPIPSTGGQVTWNTLDGTQVPLTIGILLGMLQAAMTRESALDATYRAHKAAVEASDEPWTYDYSTGWPD